MKGEGRGGGDREREEEKRDTGRHRQRNTQKIADIGTGTTKDTERLRTREGGGETVRETWQRDRQRLVERQRDRQ